MDLDGEVSAHSVIGIVDRADITESELLLHTFGACHVIEPVMPLLDRVCFGGETADDVTGRSTRALSSQFDADLRRLLNDSDEAPAA